MTADPQFSFDFDGPQSKLEKAFWQFHRDHPHVYAELVTVARELVGFGVSHVSINHCFEVARNRILKRTRDVLGFKLNNNHRAYYSRLIMRDEADLNDVFNLRQQKIPATIGPDNEALPSGEHVA